jgi:hypothetical protein
MADNDPTAASTYNAEDQRELRGSKFEIALPMAQQRRQAKSCRDCQGSLRYVFVRHSYQGDEHYIVHTSRKGAEVPSKCCRTLGTPWKGGEI